MLNKYSKVYKIHFMCPHYLASLLLRLIFICIHSRLKTFQCIATHPVAKLAKLAMCENIAKLACLLYDCDGVSHPNQSKPWIKPLCKNQTNIGVFKVYF